MPAAGTQKMGRYVLEREVGRGGMANVWLARDESTGVRYALKRLRVENLDSKRNVRLMLFEGEYHALAHLRHPNIVRVEDYGVEDGEAYYTMELLEGGDLHERGIVAWRDLAPILCDIASALALVHSRRFVHRDVKPRNVRFGSDGKARIIDFGALAPFGVSREVVGTPAFVPPEALNGQHLDGRSDLYALGALAYYVLSGRHAYPARTIQELRDCWRSRPRDIAAITSELPPAFGALVMSLLSGDPSARPASASEVSDRLCQIAALPRRDDAALRQAFLVMPKLVGRDEPLNTFRRHIAQARRGRGVALLVEGESGMGRTRFLERCVLESKISGAVVLQANATDSERGDYGALQALGEQLIAAAPEKALEHAEAAAPWLAHAIPDVRERLGVAPCFEPDELRRRQRVHDALVTWFCENAQRKHMVIAIDDVHVFDDRSLAVIVGLVQACNRLALNLVITRPLEAEPTDAVRVLIESTAAIKLRRLDLADFTTLVRSLFGDVHGATAFAETLYGLCGGIPSACIAFAQHLVDQRLVRYEQDGWVLPENLPGLGLPSGVRALHERKLDALDDDARELAETLALAERATPIEYYPRLTSHGDSGRMHAALQSLLTNGVLARTATAYAFANPSLHALLRERTPAGRACGAHLRLARVLESIGVDPMELAWHLLQGGERTRATDLAIDTWRRNGEDPGAAEIIWVPHLADTLEPLIESSEQSMRSPRDVFVLREFLMVATMWIRPGYALDVSRPLEQRLRIDLGLVYWDEVSGASPVEKVTACLERALGIHDATPEPLRGLHPLTALQHMGRYVLYATQCASATARVARMRELVALIAPLAGIAPALELIHRLACATSAGLEGSAEESQAGLEEVLVSLRQPDIGLPENHRALFRLGVIFGLGLIRSKHCDGRLLEWADELEGHVLHEANAWRLRRMYHLHESNMERAHACQERVDTLSLLQPRELSGTITMIELWCAGAYGDFQGVRRARGTAELLAQRYPEYTPLLQLAQGIHHLLSGNAEAAELALNSAALEFECGGDTFKLGLAEDFLALACLERGHGARAREVLVRRMHRPDVWFSSVTSAATMAVCEAEAGEIDRAVIRSKTALAAMDSYALHGPYRVIALEGAMRVALIARDGAMFERAAYALLQLCEGDRCPSLLGRHAALVKKAQRSSLMPQDTIWLLAHDGLTNLDSETLLSAREVLDACRGTQERVQCALRLMLEDAQLRAGFSFAVEGPTGVRLVATSEGAVPPQDLEQQVRERMNVWWPSSGLQVDEDTMDLDATPDAAALDQHSGILTSMTGSRFQLVPLRTPRMDRPVAVVALQLEGEVRKISFALVEMLALALVEAGDVTLAKPSEFTDV